MSANLPERKNDNPGGAQADNPKVLRLRNSNGTVHVPPLAKKLLEKCANRVEAECLLQAVIACGIFGHGSARRMTAGLAKTFQKDIASNVWTPPRLEPRFAFVKKGNQLHGISLTVLAGSDSFVDISLARGNDRDDGEHLNPPAMKLVKQAVNRWQPEMTPATYAWDTITLMDARYIDQSNDVTYNDIICDFPDEASLDHLFEVPQGLSAGQMPAIRCATRSDIGTDQPGVQETQGHVSQSDLLATIANEQPEGAGHEDRPDPVNEENSSHLARKALQRHDRAKKKLKAARKAMRRAREAERHALMQYYKERVAELEGRLAAGATGSEGSETEDGDGAAA
ncbi:hypothetical protein VTJ49DRAFT_499 [Mycothermus thermophilus]|uniref:Uncharacterized protein n=1 Tax=Humicola insolens TaxID=85995 RepID=A0ABR3VF34_HUMIN